MRAEGDLCSSARAVHQTGCVKCTFLCATQCLLHNKFLSSEKGSKFIVRTWAHYLWLIMVYFPSFLSFLFCWEFVKCTGNQSSEYLLAWAEKDTGYEFKFSRQQMKDLMWRDVTASLLSIASTEPKAQTAAWKDVKWGQRSIVQLCSKRARRYKSPVCMMAEQLFDTCIYDFLFFFCNFISYIMLFCTQIKVSFSSQRYSSKQEVISIKETPWPSSLKRKTGP